MEAALTLRGDKRPAVYPVMLDLTGRDALVVGGGVVGARRALGLLDAAARVTLVAPEVTPELADLALDGRIVWHQRTFDPADIAEKTLVFAATGVEAVDSEVVSAARAAGVLANAADDLARCDFHVPAVARRGDIVIAVGTGGAAPALAARLRDRFAASLGPEWERLAALLGRVRDLARDRIADPAERMRVLNVASRDGDLLAAIARGAEPDAESVLGVALGATSGTAADDELPPARAHVSLVGTGPGAPDLLTLRAVQCIREADVIVFDDLVDRRVLDSAAPGAELVYCGKRGWRSGPARPGPELLVERALEGGGRRVVRLKGGDPNIFGRSAEEFAALNRAGVSCEVVPGVTAVLAAAAAAHIPLTEREVSSSVTLVSGIAASGGPDGAEKADAANVARLVLNGGTVAVYMGLRSLPEIVAGLVSEGLPAQLPVAVISAASLPEQTVLRATLDDIVERVAEAAPASPALVILGEVARSHTPNRRD